MARGRAFRVHSRHARARAQAAPLQPAAPQDPAPGQTTAPDAGGDNGGESKLTHEQALAELAKVRQEAARYRTRVRELEPLEKAAQEAADKEKSEIQRAQEAAQQAQAELAAARLDAERFALAAKHSIPETHLQLITGDTPEARAASAALVGDLLAQARATRS